MAFFFWRNSMRSEAPAGAVSAGAGETSVTATTMPDDTAERNPASRADEGGPRGADTCTEIDDTARDDAGYGYGV